MMVASLSKTGPNFTCKQISKRFCNPNLWCAITCECWLTFLAVIGIPAAVVVVVVEHCLPALRAFLHDARTDVTALLGLLVPSDVIVELSVHNERPVYGVQVAQLRVLLNTHGASRDVSQVVKANVLQAGHLKDHQGVVVEEVPTSYDGEVGEQRAQAVQAGHPE